MFIEQLQENSGWDFLFIYDNGSDDGTDEYLYSVYKQDRRVIPYSRPTSTIHDMWNDGRDLSRLVAGGCAQHNVGIFNNDLVFDADLVQRLSEALRSDENLWCVYPDYIGANAPEYITYTTGTFRNYGMSGFCFMIRGEADIPFIDSSEFRWWGGDDMIEEEIRRAGKKVGRVNGLELEHLDGGSVSWRDDEYLHSIAHDDLARFRKKYNVTR